MNKKTSVGIGFIALAIGMGYLAMEYIPGCEPNIRRDLKEFKENEPGVEQVINQEIMGMYQNEGYLKEFYKIKNKEY